LLFIGAQPPVVRELAEMRVGMPGGHAIVDYGVADAFRLALGVFEGEQGEGGRSSLVMTNLTPLLHDARHVLGVSDIGFFRLVGCRQRGAHSH
jgi:hypothetical protein